MPKKGKVEELDEEFELDDEDEEEEEEEPKVKKKGKKDKKAKKAKKEESDDEDDEEPKAKKRGRPKSKDSKPVREKIPVNEAGLRQGTVVYHIYEIVKKAGDKGITKDKDIITYCRIGERSSHTWFVLKYLLGYPNVKNYDGSWTEWGNLIGNPIEKVDIQ